MQKPTAKASWRAEDSAVETMGSAVAAAGLADLPPGVGWAGALAGFPGVGSLRSAIAGPAPHAAVVAEGTVDGEAGDVIEADDGGGGAMGGAGGEVAGRVEAAPADEGGGGGGGTG